MCGGTNDAIANRDAVWGLSPRVRGNHVHQVGQRVASGSIPACAGEPPPPTAARLSPAVYPRVCGGTDDPGDAGGIGVGLSPRVRGNQLPEHFGHVLIGSIPACAGEPPRLTKSSATYPVYPRVCGGTDSTSAPPSRPSGLSPRVRGNRPDSKISKLRLGSIPACAGEPTVLDAGVAVTGVYPRRVRGNPVVQVCSQAWLGSIPACAGEPRGR